MIKLKTVTIEFEHSLGGHTLDFPVEHNVDAVEVDCEVRSSFPGIRAVFVVITLLVNPAVRRQPQYVVVSRDPNLAEREPGTITYLGSIYNREFSVRSHVYLHSQIWESQRLKDGTEEGSLAELERDWQEMVSGADQSFRVPTIGAAARRSSWSEDNQIDGARTSIMEDPI